MRSKNNRLLMLLVGAVISGCAGQTERSSSGGGAQAQTERREAPVAAAEPAPAPAPAPAYEPEKESVQYIDRPLEETPPPKPVAVAAVPKDEPPAEFPVTKYELPEDQAADEEVEELGAQEDESVSAEQEAAAAAESSVGETTEYADSDEEEVEDIGTQEDESVSAEQEAAAPAESSVGETTEYADADEEEVEDLGTQEDESVSAEQAAAPAAASTVGEPTEYADADQAEEVEDLGTQPDESGTISYPEEKRASADNVVGEPKVYPDEPPPKAAATAPKSITVNFETEPLFNFDKATIRADQSAKLDELISGLSGTRYDSVSVVGHADRIGKDAYNQRLSERRAAAVKAYLVKKGVPADKILTDGRGESESVTADACNNVRGKALISCLQPDRRVDVSVTATKQ